MKCSPNHMVVIWSSTRLPATQSALAYPAGAWLCPEHVPPGARPPAPQRPEQVVTGQLGALDDPWGTSAGLSSSSFEQERSMHRGRSPRCRENSNRLVPHSRSDPHSGVAVLGAEGGRCRRPASLAGGRHSAEPDAAKQTPTRIAVTSRHRGDVDVGALDRCA